MTNRTGVKLTAERDVPFLRELYVDNVLRWSTAQRYFYPGTSKETFYNRVLQLKKAGYINFPSREQSQAKAIPDKFFWLGDKGIAFIAGEHGLEVDVSKLTSDKKRKDLIKVLKRQKLYWRPGPAWSNVTHDLIQADIRLIARSAAEKIGLEWGGWTAELEFRADPQLQVVTYTAIVEDKGNTQQVKQDAKVFPDGFFYVTRPAAKPGKVDDFVFLVEVDRGTEPMYRIFDEKILQGQAYLKSPLYEQRTGFNVGRFLIITTGPTRLANIKRKAETATRKPSHYFAVLSDLTPDTFFSKPVWYLLGREEPLPLLPPVK